MSVHSLETAFAWMGLAFMLSNAEARKTKQRSRSIEAFWTAFRFSRAEANFEREHLALIWARIGLECSRSGFVTDLKKRKRSNLILSGVSLEPARKASVPKWLIRARKTFVRDSHWPLNSDFCLFCFFRGQAETETTI